MSLKLGGVFFGAVLLFWRLSFPMIVAGAPSPGSVTAGGSFKLNGVDFPATAAVPTAFNLTDRLSTGDLPAVIRFDAYGSIITVAPHSSILSGESNGMPFIRLQDGSLEYKFTNPSSMLILKRSQPVTTALAGIVTIGGHKKAIIIASSGGAAAVITTAALVTRSSSCPAGQTCK
jgi:hypothetical protein